MWRAKTLNHIRRWRLGSNCAHECYDGSIEHDGASVTAKAKAKAKARWTKNNNRMRKSFVNGRFQTVFMRPSGVLNETHLCHAVLVLTMSDSDFHALWSGQAIQP
jgi:hypothetical protein